MQNWLRRQTSFVKWTAIGTAASAATGMASVAAIVITIFAGLTLGQRTYFGTIYPPVLGKIFEASLYVMALSIVAFLIFAAGFIASLLVGTKTRRE